MAEVTIRLVANPRTGKRDIYIDYTSEEDALPHEHEKDHRRVVEELLGKGILDEDEVGEVNVQRVKPGSAQKSEELAAAERDKTATTE
jgi:hypothetical protein